MSDNTDTNLPTDVNAQAIQVLSPVEATSVIKAIPSATAPSALPSGAEIVEVCVTGTCSFAFGQAATSARLLVPGVYIYRVPLSNNLPVTTFDAIVYGGSSGSISVTRLV